MTCSVTDVMNELEEMFPNWVFEVFENRKASEVSSFGEPREYLNTYGLSIWFNDMFNYATGDAVVIYDEYTHRSIEELFKDVQGWYILEGKELLNKFNVYAPLREKATQQYFEENRKLGKVLYESVDRYFKTNNNKWCYE